MSCGSSDIYICMLKRILASTLGDNQKTVSFLEHTMYILFPTDTLSDFIQESSSSDHFLKDLFYL